MKIIVTGAAGFIGMHTSLRLVARGDHVIGVDNLNDYYDVSLKEARLEKLLPLRRFKFYGNDIADAKAMANIFAKEQPDAVIHLAAQAGVRYSLVNPQAYLDANVQGFMNILEACRHHPVRHLVYASSSSVYGGNTKLPFSEHDHVDHPVSLYAATKKANEIMAHTYSHLFNIPTTGLRFFTVYGPWGRPDMALFLFTQAMLQDKPIELYNHGNMVRDFTYIDDIVEGMIRVLDKPATAVLPLDTHAPDKDYKGAPYRIFNIGNSKPTPLMQYIFALESALGIKAKKNFVAMQAGDVPITNADTTELMAWVGFKPNTSVKEGVARFVEWYRHYYQAA